MAEMFSKRSASLHEFDGVLIPVKEMTFNEMKATVKSLRNSGVNMHVADYDTLAFLAYDKKSVNKAVLELLDKCEVMTEDICSALSGPYERDPRSRDITPVTPEYWALLPDSRRVWAYQGEGVVTVSKGVFINYDRIPGISISAESDPKTARFKFVLVRDDEPTPIQAISAETTDEARHGFLRSSDFDSKKPTQGPNPYWD